MKSLDGRSPKVRSKTRADMYYSYYSLNPLKRGYIGEYCKGSFGPFRNSQMNLHDERLREQEYARCERPEHATAFAFS